MCDDVVNQLYACGSITGQMETETELTCDMEHNSTPSLRWSPRSCDHAMENVTWSMSNLETYK